MSSILPKNNREGILKVMGKFALLLSLISSKQKIKGEYSFYLVKDKVSGKNLSIRPSDEKNKCKCMKIVTPYCAKITSVSISGVKKSVEGSCRCAKAEIERYLQLEEGPRSH